MTSSSLPDQLVSRFGCDAVEAALAHWYWEAGRLRDHYQELEIALGYFQKADALCGGYEGYRDLANRSHGADTALAIANILIRWHRLPEAKVKMSQAFAADPGRPGLLDEFAHVILRHGSQSEIRRFIEGAGSERSSLLQAVQLGYRLYPRIIENLGKAVANEGGDDQRPLAIVALPLWGKRYIDTFRNYALPALMAPGNLPEIAKRYRTVFALFASDEAIAALDGDPLMARLRQDMQIAVFPYDAKMLEDSHDRVVQYLMMSLAHYSTLSVVRDRDATAFFIFPDNIVNGTFYREACDRLHAGADGVACAGFRLDMAKVLPSIDVGSRDHDGTLDLDGRVIVRLLMEHLDDQWFADSRRFSVSPFFVVWRVGQEGLLVRANHMQPYAMRGRLIRHPLVLRVDPLDAQFMWRHATDVAAIDCVSDISMCCFDAGVEPNLDPYKLEAAHYFDEFTYARFLQVYDTPLHRRILRTPVSLDLGSRSVLWQDVETSSGQMIDRVLKRVDSMEEFMPARPAWAVAEDAGFM